MEARQWDLADAGAGLYDVNVPRDIAADRQRRLQRKKRQSEAARRKRLKRRRRRFVAKVTAVLLIAVFLIICGGWLVRVIREGTAADWETDLQEVFEPENRAAEADVEVPEEIRTFVRDHPEAASFAEDYAAYADKTYSGTIAEEPVQDGIPRLIQWDKRWAYQYYGDGYLGITGCGPTCLAMVCAGVTGNDVNTPWDIAVFSMQHDYYVEGTGSAWALMDEGARMLGLSVWEVGGDVDSIENTLRQGHPIIASMGPGDFTRQGHFIVLTGVDPDGHIRINDPNSPEKSARTWETGTILAQAKKFWAYGS